MLAVALASAAFIGVAQAQDARWHLGARATILTADAPPANDMTAVGVVFRGVGIERPHLRIVETPPRIGSRIAGERRDLR